MSRHLSLFVSAMMLTALLTNGKEINRTLFVYRSNGDIDPFFFAEIDSMRCSYERLDGSMAASPVVQEIWTPDSVYRYEIATIDSISFQAPRTIALDGTINLADELTPYITGLEYGDDGAVSLHLDEMTPDRLIPDPGTMLYQIESTEALPAGFAGQLERVSGRVLQCRAMEPEMMFSSLAWTAAGEITFDEPTSAASPGMRRITSPGLLSEPRYPHLIEGVLQMTDELRDIPAGPEIPQIRGRIAVKPQLECYTGSYVINSPINGTPMRIRRFFTAVKARVAAEIRGRYNVTEEHADKNNGKVTLKVPMGFGQECTMTYSGSMTLNGKMGLDYTLAANCRSAALSKVKYDPEEYEIKTAFAVKNEPMEVTSHRLDASMDGNVSLSGSLTLTVTQTGDSLKSLSNVFTYGCKLEGSALYLKSEIADAAENNSLYQRITATGIEAKPIESVSASAKYFSDSKKMTTKLTPPPSLIFYAVPKLLRPDFDKTSASIRYEIDGTPMTGVDSRLGAAVMNRSGNYTNSDSGLFWPRTAIGSYTVSVSSFNQQQGDIIFPTVTIPSGERILASPTWPMTGNMLFPVTAVIESNGVYVNSGTPMTGKAASGNHVVIAGNIFPINLK